MHKHFTKYVKNVIIKGIKMCVVACRAIWGIHKELDLQDKEKKQYKQYWEQIRSLLPRGRTK